MTDTTLRTAALASKAWPYEEARKLLKRYPDGKPGNAPVIFETGYGPSGLPHIGTFNEVLRTTMVRHAFQALSDAPTRLIEFSDDMDGLRKVPDNVPNQAMLTEHLGKPLSRIPDPFGKFESFAHHNNAMLRDFLDRFGFEYEFVSSSSQYESGAFDDALRGVLRHYDAIMGVMLPTLRKERAASYSPVLPISEKTGVVLQVPVEVVDAEAGLIRFNDGGDLVTQSALGGKAKLQWKVDWAMRWVAIGVDYEMYGKDLIDSGIQSGKIARILGGRPPEGFIYEMFLDEAGEKISKSKGNGLTLEQWLDYGTQQSLAFFAYREPKKAKSLHIGVIPRAVDEYFQFRGNYAAQPVEQQLGNPVHHIHNGDVPADVPPVTFGLLLNLAGVLGAGATADQVRGYLSNYIDGAITPELDALISHALVYNRDYVAPTLKRRAPAGVEVAALGRLDRELADLPTDADATAIQNIVYAIGNEGGFEQLRDWFKALYETLLGSSAGPRMGSFIALYGIAPTRTLIAEALARVSDEIRTARLVLRRARPEDVAAMHDVLSDPEVMRYWATPPHVSVEQSHDWISEMIDADEKESDDFLVTLDRRVIGKAGCWRLPEIGFALHRQFWGQGFGREAIIGVVARVFARHPIPAITADVDPRNLASLATLKRAGFVESGRAERTWFVNDEWCDSIYLALSRQRFAEQIGPDDAVGGIGRRIA